MMSRCRILVGILIGGILVGGTLIGGIEVPDLTGRSDVNVEWIREKLRMTCYKPRVKIGGS
jgi:hypothetical protein